MRKPYDLAKTLRELGAANIARGLCPTCGGAGEIFDMRAIEKTGNPHAGKRCPTCRGTGKPKPASPQPEEP